MTTTASSIQERERSQSQSQHTNNNYYNNNNPARARTRVRALDYHMERASEQQIQQVCHGDFAQAYEDAIGRPLPKVVEREIHSMMDRGICSGLIMAVLDYTAAAPRPSWAYARYVILNNYQRGINDEVEFYETLGHHG
ncbi:MAG: DnaD domain protein [Clostridia bacterium]|nr:DnaD domain protein [Clostridia bacterium]